MLRIGVQSSIAVNHEEPMEDLKRLKEIGFSSIDFSLHSYLTNKDLYKTKKISILILILIPLIKVKKSFMNTLRHLRTVVRNRG